MDLNNIAELIDKVEQQIQARNLSVRFAELDGTPVRVFTDRTQKIDIVVDEVDIYECIETDEKLRFRFMGSDGRKLTKNDQTAVAASIKNVEQIIVYQFELGMHLRPMRLQGKIVMLGWHPDYGSFVWDDDYIYNCFEDEEGVIVVDVPDELLPQDEAETVEEVSEEKESTE